MAVGAGKTALGVLVCLAFTARRALIVTPGSVIRGTFDRAFDHQAVGNALYGLPGGPLIPGCPPPGVLTLDRDEGAIRGSRGRSSWRRTSSSPTSIRWGPATIGTTCWRNSGRATST